MLLVNCLKNFVGALVGHSSSMLKRKGLKGRHTGQSAEALESRLLLSATSKKVIDNPGGINISVHYPTLNVDVEPGETVLLATMQVSRNKGKLFDGGVRIGGENFDEIFSGAWVTDGSRELARRSANADEVDLSGFGLKIKNGQQKTLSIYGQAESTLVTMDGTFSVILGQFRLLKLKPPYVHLIGSGQDTPEIHAHGPIIVNPNPAGFTVYPGDQSLNEGEATNVGFVLNTAPTSNVTLNLGLSSSVLGLTSSSVTFTPANWNVTQYVTLNAPENSIDQSNENVALTVSVNDALSADNYDPLSDQVFTYTFTDNDPTVNPVQGDFNLSVNPTSISEAGGVTTATISLNSTFTNSVSIQVSATNGLSGGTTLVFAPGETVKTVSFSAINNSVDEADRTATITATVLAGSDSRFTVGLSKTTNVTITDDDPPVVSEGPEFSRFITEVGGFSGGATIHSFVFETNLSSVTGQIAYDFNGDGNVGSDPSEYIATTVSAVVNGRVTVTFSLDVGAGIYGLQFRSRTIGINTATFNPVEGDADTFSGQDLDAVFTPNPAGGPWAFNTNFS